MAITANPFLQSFKSMGLGRFDFSDNSQPLKAMLTNLSFSPDDNQEWKSDISGEVSGAGYTAGGMTLTGLSWLPDLTNRWVVLKCDPFSWQDITISANRLVVYRWTGNASTSPLLSWPDFGTTVSKSGQDFPITFSDGVYRFQVG